MKNYLILPIILGALALQAPAAEPANPPQSAQQRLLSESMATAEDMSNMLEATDQQVQSIHGELTAHLNETQAHGAAMGEIKQRVIDAANSYVASPTEASRADFVDKLGQFAAKGAELASQAETSERAFGKKLQDLKQIVDADVERVRAEGADVKQVGDKLKELDREIEDLAKRLDAFPLDDMPQELIEKLDEALLLRAEAEAMDAMWHNYEEIMTTFQVDIEGFQDGLSTVAAQNRRSSVMLESLGRNFEVTALVVSGAAKLELLDSTYAKLQGMLQQYGDTTADLNRFDRDVRESGAFGISSLTGNRTPRTPVAMPNSAQENVRSFIEQRRARADGTARVTGR